MGTGRLGFTSLVLGLGLPVILAQFAPAQDLFSLVFPEQREIRIRQPAELTPAPVPLTPPPPTVSDPPGDLPPRLFSLDEAIRTALANAEVVRVLAGVTAVSSGRTIYDVAIVNNGIDEQRARFDPQALANNGFNRGETPLAGFVPGDPSRAVIGGLRTDDYRLDAGVSKTTITGGTLNLGVNTNPTLQRPGIFPLNPQNRSALDLSFTQPLLQGGGIRANLAPIVLSRIDTERSFFQFKDSVQDLVRSVIEAYWGLVFARTDLWARQQQVDQLREAYTRAETERKIGRVSGGVVAQTRVALRNFEATLIAARASLLDREAAFRNLLGFPPYDDAEIIPTTPPEQEQLDIDWQEVLELAGQQRPDIVELKLILEADEQLLLQARNQASPRVDAVGLYRWNGLEGEMPLGQNLSSRPGQFTDWTLAVNFSVPLGLRRERASLRRQELILSRDRANVNERLHQITHVLAGNLRNLAQFYDRYEKFRETRAAARFNLDQQIAEYDAGRIIFLNVLLAITDWGNSVSAEAQTLLQYNTELADLELQTGTILETHGIRFYEERYGAIGPLGRLHRPHCYPAAIRPSLNEDRYPSGEEPAEDSFNLESPVRIRDESPRPRPRAEIIPLPDSG